MGGSLDFSSVRRSDDLSLFKEALIFSELDKRNRIGQYEREITQLLFLRKFEAAAEHASFVERIERPWEKESDKAKYSGADLVEMYAKMFPDQVEK